MTYDFASSTGYLYSSKLPALTCSRGDERHLNLANIQAHEHFTLASPNVSLIIAPAELISNSTETGLSGRSMTTRSLQLDVVLQVDEKLQ